MHCVDRGFATAAAQTQPVHGPEGAVALLKVSSADDQGKNSHLCSAEYVPLFTPANGAATTVDLLATVADWDRTLLLPDHREQSFAPRDPRMRWAIDKSYPFDSIKQSGSADVFMVQCLNKFRWGGLRCESIYCSHCLSWLLSEPGSHKKWFPSSQTQ